MPIYCIITFWPLKATKQIFSPLGFILNQDLKVTHFHIFKIQCICQVIFEIQAYMHPKISCTFLKGPFYFLTAVLVDLFAS